MTRNNQCIISVSLMSTFYVASHPQQREMDFRKFGFAFQHYKQINIINQIDKIEQTCLFKSLQLGVYRSVAQ